MAQSNIEKFTKTFSDNKIIFTKDELEIVFHYTDEKESKKMISYLKNTYKKKGKSSLWEVSDSRHNLIQNIESLSKINTITISQGDRKETINPHRHY